MERMEFNGLRVHFIGIGGVSMQALGQIIETWGAIVTGSDSNIGKGHVTSNIHKNIDLVVMNGAISDDNVELERAKQLGIKIIDRSDLLAEIESRYKHRIAVAGTHGKSTTTAMIGAILCQGGKNPTVHNGARPNLILGGMEFFVTEACEFKRSFLKLQPTVAVITNIDADHMDCYRDLAEIETAFNTFARSAQTIIQHDGEIDSHEYKPGYFAFSIEKTPAAVGVTPFSKGGNLQNEIRICLAVPGKHNVMNAMLAVKVGLYFGISLADIKTALENFTGVERRFQKISDTVLVDSDGQRTAYEAITQVIADYAHHPTEIKTTVDTANAIFGERQYLVVFQPHTFTRTIAFFDDFVDVLKAADVVMYKTFSAREKPINGGKASDLARELGVRYFATKNALQRHIAKISPKYKAVILTGAGDINKVLE